MDLDFCRKASKVGRAAPAVLDRHDSMTLFRPGSSAIRLGFGDQGAQRLQVLAQAMQMSMGAIGGGDMFGFGMFCAASDAMNVMPLVDRHIAESGFALHRPASTIRSFRHSYIDRRCLARVALHHERPRYKG